MTGLHRLMMRILGVVLLFGSAALAQTATGSISGVVQDESGAVVPGVSVTVTNVDKGVSSSLRTDASGRYHAPSLIPGHYEIQAQVTGFETGIRKGLQVTVGSNLEITMVLKVGQVTQQTVVTAEAPIVETATSTLSGLVDDQTIRDLPLNGRSFDQLIALESSAPTFRSRSGSIAVGAANVYTVNGARDQSNLYLIDGTEMVGGGNATTLPGGALGKNMGVDAVQEFTVLTSNYSAAYGKKGGGIINIATRSGTNQIHGSAFEFLRNSVLDARNFFDSNPQPPPFKRNNFGGSLGGPLRKDRSFFFGNYEGLRESLGLTNLAVVPDANAHNGFLPGPNGQLVNVGVAPAVRPYLEALFPLPNGRNFGGGTGELLSNPNQPSVQDYFLVRFDQKISEKDSFFARYNFSRAGQTVPELVPAFASGNRSRDQVLTLEEKRAYARTVNVLRFGFTRGFSFSNSVPTIPLDPSLKFLSAADTVGQITFSGGPGITGGPLTRGGSGQSVNRLLAANQFDVADQVFHYRGPHSLQLGAQVQRIQHNDNSINNLPRGVFQFESLASFLAGTPRQFQGAAPGANDGHKSWRQIYFSTFFQDDYKMLRNLTLNLGLRYELFTVPREASGNRIANYRYRFVNGLRVLDPLPTLGNPYFQSNHDALAPRAGFSWDPFNDGKLAVRGGFGIFYDHIDSEFRFFEARNPPFFVAPVVAAPPFPAGFSGTGGVVPLPSPDVVDFGLRIPTRLQYSFGVQRQITSGSVFNIGYVGSHAYHLTRESEGNSAVPQFLPGGVVFYAAGTPRIQPGLSQVQFIASDAGSLYNSLQLNFVQRASHGVRFKISYTFAKAVDDASHTIAVYTTGEPLGTQNPFDRKGDRGLSGFDLKHNAVMNFNYDLPWKDTAGFSGRFLGGWQLGGIITLASGTPFTATTGFSRSRDLSRNIADRPNLNAGASNNPVLGGPDRYFDPTAFVLPPAGFYGNLGRNTLIGPGFSNFDLTLAKTTSVTERLKVDFRAEFFNLLNRANFGQPATAGAPVFASNGSILGSAGRIQSTLNSSRQIQFGLKLLF